MFEANSILKNCAAYLFKPLTDIFNESFTTGTFPDWWKWSSVSPIFKKCLKTDVTNYRCIAKLPTIAKFFERLVSNNIVEIIKFDILPNQHGFMKHRSKQANLMEFANLSHKANNDRVQFDVIYTNFSKAFDRVRHSKLLEKLSQFNIPYSIFSIGLIPIYQIALNMWHIMVRNQ